MHLTALHAIPVRDHVLVTVQIVTTLSIVAGFLVSVGAIASAIARASAPARLRRRIEFQASILSGSPGASRPALEAMQDEDLARYISSNAVRGTYQTQSGGVGGWFLLLLSLNFAASLGPVFARAAPLVAEETTFDPTWLLYPLMPLGAARSGSQILSSALARKILRTDIFHHLRARENPTRDNLQDAVKFKEEVTYHPYPDSKLPGQWRGALLGLFAFTFTLGISTLVAMTVVGQTSDLILTAAAIVVGVGLTGMIATGAGSGLLPYRELSGLLEKKEWVERNRQRAKRRGTSRPSTPPIRPRRRATR